MVALGGQSLCADHKDAAVALEAAVQASTIQAFFSHLLVLLTWGAESAQRSLALQDMLPSRD